MLRGTRAVLRVALEALEGLLDEVVGLVGHVCHELVLHGARVRDVLVAHLERLVDGLGRVQRAETDVRHVSVPNALLTAPR